VHGRPYLSFCPITHNSATLWFQVLMSMQVDGEFKRRRLVIGTHFVWMGALNQGRLGGG